MKTRPFALAVLAMQAVAADPVSFERDIQPIFDTQCAACHSAAMKMAKLDLSNREAAMRGGEHGAVILPGKALQSRLFRLVAGLDKPTMPLGAAKLSDAQVAAIQTWIAEGAHWDATAASKAASAADLGQEMLNAKLPPGARDYWAFQLPKQAPLPEAGASKNPVDRFLEKTRQEKSLKAAPRAAKETLVRRAYLDLLGLPPTPAQTTAFLNDKSPDAWQKLIDRLLASPHYGERWGRFWLDVARYADSSGYEMDLNRPNAWRYRDYVVKAFNDDKPFDRFIKEQIAGDELKDRTNDSYIATHFLRAGARVYYREKDNPERRYEYLDDIIATVGRGILGLTVQCARCHNHKFDPILQRDYYALEASIFGYVETDYPLAPKAEADAYLAKMAEIDAKVARLRAGIRENEAPVYERLLAEAVRAKFPKNVQDAFFKPEGERTEGEQLLASQVLDAFSGAGDIKLPVDQNLSEDAAARKQALLKEIEALEEQRPKPIAMAAIATDGDYRATPDGFGDDVVGCPVCRVKDPDAGEFLHQGPGKYQAPPSYLMLLGDVNSKGPRMEPGFVTVATYGEPATVLEPADQHTSGRRLALAEWLVSKDNPLTARVMVNRIWANHFGRGIVASVDNFGKMGEQPTHRELLDWLAVEFINRGWSVKAMHRLMMNSDAYQMASSFEDDAGYKNDPENYFLWRFQPQRLSADAVRDSVLAVSGALNPAVGGPAVFPPMPRELLASTPNHGWKQQPDGADVWRRSLYIYRKRNLAMPLLEAFDMPDPNVTAGPRTVSTVPTQSLMMLNDEFVRNQAKLFADRIREAAPRDINKQIDTAYRIALARAPDERERALARDLIERRSLLNFAHVVMNLNEFFYMR